MVRAIFHFALVAILGLAFAPVLSVGAPSVREISDANCIPADQCCKICDRGKACGNTCISRSYNCHKGRGCACNASEVCE
jgi:hypothetical protein